MSTSRRDFLKTGSILVPGLMLGHVHGAPTYTYPTIHRLNDAVTQTGEILVRLELSSDSPHTIASFAGQVVVKGAESHTSRGWFLNSENSYDPKNGKWMGKAALQQEEVVVIRLRGADEESEILLLHAGGDVQFQLKDLVETETLAHSRGAARISANLMLDREIGHMEPKDLGITDSGETFSFVLMADPQGGDPDEPTNRVPTRMKIHNAFIEESIRVVNELDPQPAFTIVNGDIVDSEGQARNFAAMLGFFERLTTPLLFELGNHETKYRSTFTPGYNMDAFANYFAAQREVNGLDKLLYSFEVGRWHFIVWPDPLRNHFWETHPHYFEWLEADLEAYREWPTIFIHHVPLHPIGIDPLTSYVESPYVKRTLLEILSRWGNVRYVFSGHVHIPFKASLKTRTAYKGMKLINLPAAGFRPRGFGEADFEGGPSQGVAVVEIEGEEANIYFKTVTDTVFSYPDPYPQFDPQKWPLWLSNKWELPLNKELVNGSFEAGLKGWHRRFVYEEDERPANLCEVQELSESGHDHTLYLYARERRYNAPGQDRMPQTLNQICQAISVPAGQQAIVRFTYRLDSAHSRPLAESAAFVWIEGFSGSFKGMNLVYSHGKMIPAPGSRYSNPQQAWYRHFDLPGDRDIWNEVVLHLSRDARDQVPPDFAMDRLVINLGVWTANEDGGHETGVWLDDFVLEFVSPDRELPPSMVGKTTILPKPESGMWTKRNRHIAGEHRYIEM